MAVSTPDPASQIVCNWLQPEASQPSPSGLPRIRPPGDRPNQQSSVFSGGVDPISLFRGTMTIMGVN